MALSAGRYTLKAYDNEGRWLEDTQIRVLNEGNNDNVDFTLHKPVARVGWRGTIRNLTGEELASAEVILYLSDCEGCAVGRAKSNGKGEYEIPELAAFRTYQISVEFNGHSSALEKLYVSTVLGYRADLTIDRTTLGLAINVQPYLIPILRRRQRASVMQTIGVTDIMITYSRPGVRGRSIWGDAPANMAARARGEATLDDQSARMKG